MEYCKEGKVIKLREYTEPEDIKHVMYERQEIESTYLCEVCGPLQVISGTVCHTRSIEEHNT